MNKDKSIAILAFIVVFVITAIISYNFFGNKNTQNVNVPMATSTATTTTVSTSTTTTPPPSNTSTGLKGYYIALEDAGKLGKKIGCNDSVVGVPYSVPATQSPLKKALEDLLANNNQQVGQYYNALAASNLSLSSVGISNGLATIQLQGQLVLGGTCDSPRVKAQIEETARQFASVTNVAVFINGTPIDQALSQQ